MDQHEKLLQAYKSIPRESFTYWPESAEAELTERLHRFTLDYSIQAVKGRLGWMVKRGKGREGVGAVPYRPDDWKIKLDAEAEQLFNRKALEHELRLLVMTEDGWYLLGTKNIRDIEAIAAFDPIDNSAEFQAGLDTPQYSVFTFFARNLKPLVGTTCDFLKEKALIYKNGANTLLEYSDDIDWENRVVRWKATERQIELPPVIHDVTDPGFRLASYMGSNEYSLPFIDHFRELLKKMNPHGKFHGKGGTHAYYLMAIGGLDTYVMVDELRTETSAAYHFARAAGFNIWVYSKNGNPREFAEYEFLPEFEDNVHTLDLVITSNSPIVRDQIATLYYESLEKAA